MMKQILLLTDFSENSVNAIHYALNLFKDDKCNFYILHVESSKSYLSDDLVLGGNQSIHDTIVKKSKHKLSELIENLKAHFKNDNYTFHKLVDYDSVIDAVNQVKTSKAIDLIVMGSNGVTGAKETIFGSNTVNVIRNVNCPTLVIPEGFLYVKPSEVVLPLDLNDVLNSNAFVELLKFTEHYSDKIHLLRLIPNNELSQELEKDTKYMTTHMKNINYAYHVINDVPMNYAVRCYTQTHDINLSALLVQKEGFFEHFFTSSSTSKISNTLRVPLLVFHS